MKFKKKLFLKFQKSLQADQYKIIN